MAAAAVDLNPTWTDDEKRQEWYTNGIAYWEKTAQTNDGVLGGYGMVHEVQRLPVGCECPSDWERAQHAPVAGGHR